MKYLISSVSHKANMQDTISIIEKLNPENVNTVKMNLDLRTEPMLNSVKSCVGGDIEMVYNLQISEKPEYFANNILVHNCVMSLALAVHGKEEPAMEYEEEEFGLYSTEYK